MVFDMVKCIWEYGDSEYGDYGDGVQTVVFFTYLIDTLFL